MPISMKVGKNNLGRFHSLRITAFCLYVLAQGYHKGVVQGHLMFLNFNMVEISNKLLYNKNIFKW